MIAGNQPNPDRSSYDDYPTDPRWVDALDRAITIPPVLWEPAAGSGQMASALRTLNRRVIATDVQQGRDFLTETRLLAPAIITNPPYRLANRFIAHALELGAEWVAMLLPIGYLAGQSRMIQYRTRPPADVVIVSNRMRVTGKTSQFNHIWIVWASPTVTTTRLRWELA